MKIVVEFLAKILRLKLRVCRRICKQVKGEAKENQLTTTAIGLSVDDDVTETSVREPEDVEPISNDPCWLPFTTSVQQYANCVTRSEGWSQLMLHLQHQHQQQQVRRLIGQRIGWLQPALLTASVSYSLLFVCSPVRYTSWKTAWHAAKRRQLLKREQSAYGRWLGQVAWRAWPGAAWLLFDCCDCSFIRRCASRNMRNEIEITACLEVLISLTFLRKLIQNLMAMHVFSIIFQR